METSGIKMRKNNETGPKIGNYSELSKIVIGIAKDCSFWDLFGRDLCVIASGFFLLPFGFLCLRYSGLLFLLGLFILGTVHVMFITKGAHSATHMSLFPGKYWNRVSGVFFSEICGGFTFQGGVETHISIHHPHTNVIGLGDSSIWKVPFLNREMYLFIAPFFLPLVAPFFSASLLWGKWKEIAKNFLLVIVGFVGQYSCFRLLSGLAPLWSVFCLCVVRGLYYCTYIHVNIFQHIGLSMYSPKRRPLRLRLMATGALNLSRNPLLDYCIGHSLISCHVEHHLFPNLSDNMCLKIKPTVKKYIEENGLPYQEDSYWNRLKIFYNDYKQLMVDAPPITEFIGIQ